VHLILGDLNKFELEEKISQFTIPSLTTYFSDAFASLYQPIIYGREYSFPPPEGIYYRIILSESLGEFSIQYNVYWLDQNCLGRLPIADHKYDYEPIFIFVRPPKRYPVGIING
jgi:hypothetical protein